MADTVADTVAVIVERIFRGQGEAMESGRTDAVMALAAKDREIERLSMEILRLNVVLADYLDYGGNSIHKRCYPVIQAPHWNPPKANEGRFTVL